MFRYCSVAISLTVLIGCTAHSPNERPLAKGNKKPYTIAVIPKGTTHEYWKSVHAGAAQAAKELGVQVLWKGPLSESDGESQINVLQDFVTRRVDGICLAPVDSQALVASVREAREAGIPTVVFDSGLEDSQGTVSYVATDNFNGGAVAARHLGKLLGGRGKVILLRYTVGSQATELRENGFLETLKKEFPQIEILSDGEHADSSAESALAKAQQLLQVYGDEVDGIFTPCQHVSSGMLKALEERNLDGKVKFVGFDSGPDLVAALRNGKMHGIVLQDPVGMASLAVKTLVAHLQGEKVSPRIATGETLATPESMEQPQIKRLLQPAQFDE
jgi:ribose transport system substrate-binding protein